jgi:hypothetical protein
MENADDGAAQAQQAGQAFDSDVSAAVICHLSYCVNAHSKQLLRLSPRR